MTDDPTFELSRRKVLGALGTVGAASAGAGLGTSAYFSDTESFDNNSLVAGELDLHVGWEEHYSDWSEDEGERISSIEMVGPGETADPDRVGLPLDADTAVNGSMITVENVSQARRFLNNTETAPNGSYANVTGFDPSTASGDPCSYLASGSNQSPVIVDLDDVKPGDFGEVTFSFALCDNPGYVWINGDLQSASEGGYTEPELDDPDESGSPGDDPANDTDIELLDKVRAALWYDDGDNLQSGGGTTGGAADVMIVADGSGSVTSDSGKFQSLQDGAEALVNSVGSNVRIGLTVFSDSASTEATLADDKSTTVSEVQDDSNYPGGGTDIGAGITEGQNQLTSGAGARSGVDKVLVVLTNGRSSTGRSEATTAKNAGTTIYGIAYGSGADENLIEDISSPPKNDDGSITSADQFAFLADQTDISQVFSNIGGQITTGEEVFLIGTLREALNALSADPTNGDYGLPLDGDRSSSFDEVNGSLPDSNRNEYEAGVRHDLGFAWWLPVDVGNEAQTDTATFSLGFYTEQSRHNDGSGQPS